MLPNGRGNTDAGKLQLNSVITGSPQILKGTEPEDNSSHWRSREFQVGAGVRLPRKHRMDLGKGLLAGLKTDTPPNRDKLRGNDRDSFPFGRKHSSAEEPEVIK